MRTFQREFQAGQTVAIFRETPAMICDESVMVCDASLKENRSKMPHFITASGRA